MQSANVREVELSETLQVAVIGLGVMGLRMLERLRGHARLRPSVAWDSDRAALQRACARFPDLRPQPDLASALSFPGLACAYIATPPDSHLVYAGQAFDAGLAVLCEKPLSTDPAQAQAVVQRVGESRLRAAVNFPLASSAALAALAQACRDPRASGLGSLQGIELELAFSAWPRPWQAGAGDWLSERAQGGFTREVMSHFIFVLLRLLGRPQVLHTEVEYPADDSGAERRVRARLQFGGIDAEVSGAIEGEVADRNRLRLRGSHADWELRDWSQLWQRPHGGGWQGVALAPVADPYADWVAMIEGRPHGLATFDEAWGVQETIEALLAPTVREFVASR